MTRDAADIAADAPPSVEQLLQDFADSRPEERYVPAAEPFLSRWCALHVWHLAALEQLADETVVGDALRATYHRATRLADVKYRIYISSLQSGAR